MSYLQSSNDFCSLTLALLFYQSFSHFSDRQLKVKTKRERLKESFHLHRCGTNQSSLRRKNKQRQSEGIDQLSITSSLRSYRSTGLRSVKHFKD